MTLPVLGPMTLTGFEHVWFFLFLFVVLGLVALYIAMQASRRKRLLRFAKTPVAVAASGDDSVGAVIGDAHGRDGRAHP